MFEKLKEFLHAEFEKLGLLTSEMKADMPVVISKLEEFKGIVENPTIDGIAEVLDPSLSPAIISGIDTGVTDLLIAGEITEDVLNQKTPAEKLLMFAQDIQKYNVLSQHLWVGNLAALVIKALGGGKLSVSQARQLAEAEYADFQTA